MNEVIKKRYEFVILFDVENGNPNGDPDAGNMPRIDPETGHGIVTDVCLKRKIRNYVDVVKQGADGYNIYVREGAILNRQHEKAYIANNIDPKDEKTARAKVKDLTKFMCDNFFDIRAFGAVMTTEVNCGQVRGPVQINFARSIDPIVQQEVTITRMAVTNEKDADKKGNEMGRKHIVPYALYRAEGYISAHLAEKVTGFTEEDLELLWEGLINMFDHDHSAARGKMATRRLIVFEHSSMLGNAPAHKLFESVKVKRIDSSKPVRSYSDYNVIIDRSLLPEGVNLIEKL
ncbi:MAG: CRISPR-associated protein Csd2 [Petroclostridium sp.]|jgi:CRISPR-associated protein Csd2|nr:CRISPR-associated protein Csd2 family [Clostridia bacterium]MDK2809549.1 CRISPR-associated protein Csd2 [Petroclostridium sp.]